MIYRARITYILEMADKLAISLGSVPEIPKPVRFLLRWKIGNEIRDIEDTTILHFPTLYNHLTEHASATVQTLNIFITVYPYHLYSILR